MKHRFPRSFSRFLCTAIVAATVAAPALVARAAPDDGVDQGNRAVLIDQVTRNKKTSNADLLLAEKGAAKMPIVISAQASDNIKFVAKDLAEYLTKISGAPFKVEVGDGTKGIVLGNLGDFDVPELGESLEIRNSYDGKEAYAIRTQASRVLLIGATDLGTSHAAYRMLRELGYRWFFPAKVWEVVPKIETLTFGLDITDRPQILSRNIWFEAGSGTAEANDSYFLWRMRNSQTESFVSNAGHNLFVVPGMFPEEFKAHPEYYAQNAEGARLGDDIELTNPEVRKLVVEYARRFFKQNPNADMVSIDPVDSTSHSQSPAAREVSYSDQIFGVANEVAVMLQDEFPGKMVGLLSYNAHWDPPSFDLESNVHVQKSGLGQGQYTSAERDRIWSTRSRNLGTYEYYSVFLWNYDMLPGSWTNNVEGVHGSVKSLVNSGITAVSAESTSNWGLNGRGYYAATNFMWNADQDPDALMDDFYQKAFGPAAPAMKKYYDIVNPGNIPFMSRYTLGAAFRAVDEATRLAQGKPDVMARIDFIKQYLRFQHLAWAQNHDGVQGLGEKIDSQAYRLRNDANLTWEMARQTWWGNKDWSGEIYQKPFTREEIEEGFQEGLKYFPVRTVAGEKPVKFSTDLVPIVWPDATPDQNVESKQTYQGSMKYALYSVNGEPLEFTTEAGDAWGYMTRFTVTDSEGKEIAEGKPAAKVLVTHSIEVPAAGLYYLNYNDPGAYWTFTASPETIVSICVDPAVVGARSAQVMQDMYFYVPKGTRTLEYFFAAAGFQVGGQHQVLSPDGTVQKEVNTFDDYVSISVPNGMDGQLWKIHSPSMGRFFFTNIAPYFAPSPSAVLVPREVAEKDELTIRQ